LDDHKLILPSIQASGPEATYDTHVVLRIADDDRWRLRRDA
jgi:hypothetical protein